MSSILKSREKFKEAAKKGNILLKKCKKCNNIMLETIYFCEKCNNHDFEEIEKPGQGKVVTYTIQSVVPEDFEDTDSYAWVVFRIDTLDINASGFLSGIRNPSDLPINCKVRISGFEDKHGLILEKTFDS